MKRNKSNLQVGIIVLFMLALVVSAAMAYTPAGTQIRATSTVQYYSGSGSLMPTATSNTVVTSVAQIGAVILSPSTNTQTNTPGSPVYFAATVQNAGNGSDTISLSSSSQSGSTVKIYKDDNGDGTHQSTETTVVTSTGALTAGSSYKFMVSVQLLTTASTDTVKVTAASQFDNTKTATSSFAVSENANSASYIQTWLVNLPYGNTTDSTRLSTDYLNGEADVMPSAGDISGQNTWTLFDSSNSVIDLNAAAGAAQTKCAGYANVYVNSPSTQTASLWLGSDNGIKAWLNGKVIWTNDSTRGYTADQDKVTINLVEGWNRLLVKVSQYGGNWLFSARICTTAGDAIQGLVYQTDAPEAAPIAAPVISNVVLASAGPTSAVITWDTDQASNTLVDFGTTTSFGQSYTDANMVTHHTASLTDLSPSTTYYLKVGSANSSGAVAWMDSGYSFTTAQAAGTASSYIQTWLVNLPYGNTTDSTRLSTDYLNGEADVMPSAGVVSGQKTWTLFESSNSVIDLNAAAGAAQTKCAGYAHVYVNSPSAQTASLWLGSDNGIKAWLNGNVIWTNDSTRGYTADQDKVTISLQAGWNTLLVKVSQYGGNWLFSARICTTTGDAIQGLTYQTDEPKSTTIAAPVISNVALASAGTTSAVITWDTDQASNTMVDFGTTTSFGQSYTDANMVTHHSATLTGLNSSTTYYLRVGSSNAMGETTWMNNGYNFTTAAPAASTSPYITKWLMNGYYQSTSKSTALATDFLGGEAGVSPVEGSASSNGTTWKSYSSTSNTINLGAYYNMPKNCAGYAFAYVYSPKAQSATLSLGSDDGIKVWLNGKLVFTLDTSRACADGSNKVPVSLNAGWNRLLVKISQGSGNWKFILKTVDSSSNMIPGITYSLSPQ